MLDATSQPLPYAQMLARLSEELPRRSLSTEIATGLLFTKSAFLARVEAVLGDRTRIRRLSRWALAGTIVSVLASLVLAMAVPLGEKAAPTPASRVLHFPADHALGLLKDLSKPKDAARLEWWWMALPDAWEDFGMARGGVAVPAGTRLGLVVSPDAWPDLSPLAKLPPDAIEVVGLYVQRDFEVVGLPSWRGKPKPGDAALAQICALTGIRELHLDGAEITNPGLAPLKYLTSLERLCVLTQGFNREGLAHICAVKSLKSLRLGHANVLTGDDLSLLSQLTSLQELFIEDEVLETGGLVHLSRLPSLAHLFIAAGNVGPQGLSHLAEMPPLTHLEFLDLTGEGLAALPPMPALRELEIQCKGNFYMPEEMANLSRFTKLERLRITAPITDDGLAPLKALTSLKNLYIEPSFPNSADVLSDAALAHLLQIKSLESLRVYTGRFSDQGLEYLSQLPNLRVLEMPNNSGFTDAGLKHIARMQHLDSLYLRGEGLSRNALDELSRELPTCKIRLLSPERVQSGNGDAPKEQGRVLHFPADRAIGMLKDLDKPSSTSDADWWWMNMPSRYADFHMAQGRVLVPAGTRLGLVLNPAEWSDLSPLAELPPDAIEAVGVYTGMEWGEWGWHERSKPGDETLAQICALTGLRELQINGGNISNAGLAPLEKLTPLERLALLAPTLNREGFEHIGKLKTLTGLRIGNARAWNGEDLALLANLKNLKELSLGWREGGEAAMAQIAKLPSLEHLYLGGGNMGPEGLERLAELPKLKRLEIYDLMGEGLAALPAMPNLRRLRIQWKGRDWTIAEMASLSQYAGLEEIEIVTPIPDDGLAHLAELASLKSISIQDSMMNGADALGDAAIAHISKIKSLESVKVGMGRFSDKTLEDLSGLPNLRVLEMPNNSGFTNAGLTHIAKMKHLESLYLRGNGLSNRALDELSAALPGCKIRLLDRGY